MWFRKVLVVVAEDHAVVSWTFLDTCHPYIIKGYSRQTSKLNIKRLDLEPMSGHRGSNQELHLLQIPDVLVAESSELQGTLVRLMSFFTTANTFA